MLPDWKIEAIFNTDHSHFTERQLAFLKELEELGLETGEISPFIQKTRKKGQLSTGLTSAGYDLSLNDSGVRIFSDRDGSRIIDPLKFASDTLTSLSVREDSNGNWYYILPPHASALASAVEHFRIPNWVCGVATGKSSYARCGLKVNITPLEPGWHGHLVLEFFNTTPLPLKVYAHQGFSQIQFYETGQVELCYNTKGGRYQNQEAGIVYARS